jgi:hypothetical protein
VGIDCVLVVAENEVGRPPERFDFLKRRLVERNRMKERQRPVGHPDDAHATLHRDARYVAFDRPQIVVDFLERTVLRDDPPAFRLRHDHSPRAPALLEPSRWPSQHKVAR